MRILWAVILCAIFAHAEDRPLGHAGKQSRDDAVADYLREYGYEEADVEPVPDRWRIGFPRWDRTAVESEKLKKYDSPYAIGRGRNPYRQNVWKGDYPIFGQDIFFVATLISDTTVEFRDLPTPASISTARPNNPQFFGSGRQFFFNQNFVTSFELFKGQTAFKPPDWLVRLTPVFNLNYLDVRENNAVNIDVREGTTRTDGHIGLQEAFVEKHLADLSPNYDFLSVIVGIQQFVADPRALLFFDNNLGARVVANWDNNRSQANAALFYMLEKDINSELNTFDARDQWVFVANYTRQDVFWFGYSLGATFAWNRDDGGPHKDQNGFPVRPPPVGAATISEVDAFYLGFNGDGHIGRLNITHEYFYVFGNDRSNYISGKDVDISAHMFFAELSYDVDWWRPRFSFLWASGDDDPFDSNGKGFDTILDNPNISGGANSYWIRQSLRLAGTGLNSRLSTFPNLRPNKFQGQANFVNPGLFFLTAGADLDLAVEWRATLDFSYLMFAKTGALEPLLNQNDIDRALGWEATLGVQYRPNAVNNIQLFSGASAFFPGAGYRDIYESGSTVYSVFVQLLLTY
ncbi:MAG: hypothetical protein ACYS0E_05055 [Planctomycetota bacterium]